MKGLRIGRRRSRTDGLQRTPLERALAPALADDRWQLPDRFNFARDVVGVLADDPKRAALTFLATDGVIEPRTFLQLAEGAARWAFLLREREIQPGDRVLVLASGSVDWLEVMLACLKIGAVAVPTSPAKPAAALEARFATTGASLIVADHECEHEISQMSFLPDVHYVHDGGRRRAPDIPDESPTHNTSLRDLAFILATSGTAGPPKLVAHTHASVFAARAQAEHWLDAGRGDAVWCTAGTGSPEAVWNALIGPWSRGAEVVLHQGEFDPLERLDLLHRLSPTILCQSPAEYRALAELRELPRFRSQRLRRLVSTGDYLEPEVVEVFEQTWGLTIHDGYGQAETNIVVANGAEAAFKPGSIGRPIPGHHIAIVDDQGDELPPGIEGDLAVRGRPPTLFAGYWEAPEETKNAFRGDWYVTGDVAVADEDGFLWFMGRAEDVITSRGRTFGPYEVEHTLRGHEAVGQCAVVGLRDLERGGQFIRAFVVLQPGVEPSEQLEAELRHFVGESLPDQQVPREVEFVDELPTTNGKIRRLALRERPAGGRPLWELPPTSELEIESLPSQPEASAQLPAIRPELRLAVTPEPEPVAEPAAEAAPVPEPEPPPVVVQEPEPEPQPELRTVPVPEPESGAAWELERVWESDPETAREAPTPAAPVAEAAPVPEPTPIVARAPEPEPLPDYVVEPTTGPEPAPVARTEPTPEPEAVAPAAPEPLPDFIVDPAERPEPIAPISHAPRPKTTQEPEPEPDLGPLPDYIVDPTREPVPTAGVEPELRVDASPPATPKPVVTPGPDAGQPTAPPAGVEFPPAASFPSPRDEDTDGERRRKAPKTSRSRPTATSGGKPRRGRSTGVEPGDEADEVGWMQGLSNRLSAYSLSEDEEPAAPGPDEGASENDESDS